MKKLLFLLLLSSETLFAQVPTGNPTVSFFIDQAGIFSSTNAEIKANADGDTIIVLHFGGVNPRTNIQNDITKTYMGTPYFKNGWDIGTVWPKKTDTPRKGKMAYNIQKDLVFFSVDKNKDDIEIKPEMFEIKGHRFQLYDDVYKKTFKAYYEKLHNGSVVLLKQYICDLLPITNDDKSSYGVIRYEGTFKKNEKLYLVIDNELNLVRSKKKILSYFPKQSSALEAFIDKQKLDITKEKDLIEFLRFVENLK